MWLRVLLVACMQHFQVLFMRPLHVARISQVVRVLQGSIVTAVGNEVAQLLHVVSRSGCWIGLHLIQ
jgi:hypothetical protein